MAILVYDGSFEGFLTLVFECYAQKLQPIDICKESMFNKGLFTNSIYIETNEQKSDRVWKAILQKLHPRNKELPVLAFLSEQEGIEMRLYRFFRRTFDSRQRIDTDFGDPDVLSLKKTERQVMRECMRVLQFVRFQQTADDVYFAAIEPLYDVLPYSIAHFKSRFADQLWLIYDLKRDYGFFYDRQTVQEVVLQNKAFSETDGQLNEGVAHEKEAAYQSLWQSYFEHINIAERKNLKLQKQHMPRRYWKFLPEKNHINPSKTIL